MQFTRLGIDPIRRNHMITRNALVIYVLGPSPCSLFQLLLLLFLWPHLSGKNCKIYNIIFFDKWLYLFFNIHVYILLMENGY